MGSHLLASNKTEVLLMNKIKNTEQERSIKRILRKKKKKGYSDGHGIINAKGRRCFNKEGGY